jgi:tetratricopeptide (TPR) repeat protein
MKLAWLLVVGLSGVAAAGQAELAAKANQDGVDLMLKSKYADAAAKFKDAFARDPQAKYVFNLCTADYQLGRFDEALTACSSVEKLQTTAELQAKTEKLIQKIKDEAAAQHLELTPAEDTPTDPGAKSNQEGVELMLAGKYADAVPKFKDAVAHDPQAKYYFNLCTADYQLGKFRDALDACKAVGKLKAVAELQTKTDKLMAKIRTDAKAQKITIE